MGNVTQRRDTAQTARRHSTAAHNVGVRSCSSTKQTEMVQPKSPVLRPILTEFFFQSFYRTSKMGQHQGQENDTIFTRQTFPLHCNQRHNDCI